MQEFKKSFDSFGQKSFISIELIQTDIIKYQSEMIKHNTIDGLLGFDLQRVNGEEKLLYDITSRIQLTRILERRKLTKNEIILIIKEILSTIKRCDNYLLDLNSLLIEFEYIYIDPVTLNPKLIYLPIKRENDNLQTIRSFIKDLVFEKAVLENDGSSYVQKLIEIVKDESLSIDQIYEAINSISVIDGNKSNYTNKETVKNGIVGKNEIQYKKPLRQEKEPKIKKEIFNIAKSNYNNNNNKETAKETKKTYPYSSYIVGGGVNIALLVLIILMAADASFKDDPFSKIFAVLILVAVINYFIITRLFNEEKAELKEVEEKMKNNNENSSSIKSNYIKESKVNKRKRQFNNIDNHQQRKIEMPKNIDRENQDENDTPLYDQTVMLNEDCNSNYPLLLGKGQNVGEKIVIDKERYVIGRYEENVDCSINHPAVGRIHAEIERVNNSYFITDLNSKNGTYINNERLTPSEKCKLTNNCIIRIANQEYIFVYGE